MTNAGFYKNENGILLYGSNEISNINYTLTIDNYATYNYPVDGWYYFSDEATARTALNCPVPIIVPPDDAHTDEDNISN